MWKATLRGLLGRRLRLALTTAAVAVSVGLVAGTFVLTDTLGALFDGLFEDASSGIDVTVRSTAHLGSGPGLAADRDRIPASLLDTVRAVDGVAAAEGTLFGLAQLVAPDGEAIRPRVIPGLGFSWPETDALGWLRLREGRKPAARGEVAVDVATARRYGFGVGDRVRVLLAGPAEPFSVVGTFTFGDSEGAGTTVAAFDTATAQRVFGAPGLFDTITVAGEHGVASELLRDRVAAVLPVGVEAVMGAEAAAQDADTLRGSLGFLNTVLLVFAGVGVVVGAFLIHNTFTILVAQRVRELGLLRAVGAGGRQVLGSVLGEATAVGALGSALGLAAGIGLAVGLLALLANFGVTLPEGPPAILGRTVVVAALVGVLVTVASSAVPAWRAARIAPAAAVLDAPPTASGRPARGRATTGGLLILVGTALVALGLSGHAGRSLEVVAAGAFGVFVGVATLSQFMARPAARVLGAGLPRIAGVPGTLARENAMRNPRRTANTSAALMVGVSLVTLVAVLAASARASVGAALRDGLEAEYVLSAAELFPFSAEVVPRLTVRPEVAAAAALRLGIGTADGQSVRIAAVDPRRFARAADLGLTAGALADLVPGTVLVHRGVVEKRGWHVGDEIVLGTPRAGAQQVRVAGIFSRNQLTFANYVIPLSTYEASFATQQDSFVYVKLASGVSASAGAAAIDAVLEGFPNVERRDRAAFNATLVDQIDRILAVVYLLLAFAVITALLGITNTLALSIVERRRELGLLRAVGMSRRQVGAMISWEAALVALLGAFLGVVLGLGFGWVLTRALAEQGVSEFVLPAGSVLAFLGGAAVAGVAASLLPAWRAARVDVLAAVAYE